MIRDGNGTGRMGKGNVHAVFLGDGADVVGSGDGAEDGCLLLVVREAFAGEVRAATLGDLENDGGLDIPVLGLRLERKNL